MQQRTAEKIEVMPQSPSLQSKLLFRSGFLKGARLSKCPRSHAKDVWRLSKLPCTPERLSATAYVEQSLDVSVEVDQNVLQERISEGMRDKISRKHVQCYFKLCVAWMYAELYRS